MLINLFTPLLPSSPQVMSGLRLILCKRKSHNLEGRLKSLLLSIFFFGKTDCWLSISSLIWCSLFEWRIGSGAERGEWRSFAASARAREQRYVNRGSSGPMQDAPRNAPGCSPSCRWGQFSRLEERRAVWCGRYESTILSNAFYWAHSVCSRSPKKWRGAQ